MKYILRQFYNISAVIGVLILLGTFIFWDKFSYLQALALLNLAVINFHFFEEFGFPGGFPKFANTIFAYKDSPRPERFPLNQMSAILINWGTALVLYVPPIFFPNCIWFGLAPILFGGIAQLIMHGIINNKLLHTYYNAGLASTLFGHFPLMIFYINYIVKNNIATVLDWVLGVVIFAVWYLVVCRLLIGKSLADMNSPYPFAPEEMRKFDRFKK